MSVKINGLNINKIKFGGLEVTKMVFNGSTVYQNAESCTIMNLGSQDPSNVTFTKTAGFPTESQAWEEVVIGNDHFAKFTPWYKKTIYNSNNEVTGFVISNKKENNNFVPYDCFLDESGNLLPYILIGRYCCSNTTTADSTDSESYASADMVVGAARDLCRAKGTGYQMYDAAMHVFWRDLALACSENVNFNDGTGGVNSYLGMDRMMWDRWWIDGLTNDNQNYLYCSKPSKYIDAPTSSSDGYSVLSYTMTWFVGCISKLGYDSNHPTVNLPCDMTSNQNYDTYYCDEVSCQGNVSPCYVIIGYDMSRAGLFFLASPSNPTYSRFCARLCYKPIS